MPNSKSISTPDDLLLDDLCRELAERADALDQSGEWPAEQLTLCGQYGVYRWFAPQAWDGLCWSELDIVRGYLRLSAACLTTTFVITQFIGACRRIIDCENQSLKERLVPDLISGKSFATVGISHLTTSRRHLAKPVLHAAKTDDGFVLNGFSPWVTGAKHAQDIVLGATLDDGRQILVALPTDLPGVRAGQPATLVGLSASHTGDIRCDNVLVPRDCLIDGPVENVMAGRSGAKPGGLQTSTLAVGLASAAIRFLENESQRRADLQSPAEGLRAEQMTLEADLLAIAAGQDVCSNDELRTRANSLVLRATQAALVSAKGTGYVAGHSAGRWCREALFFLVWSCPAPVLAANLCELAGLG